NFFRATRRRWKPRFITLAPNRMFVAVNLAGYRFVGFPSDYFSCLDHSAAVLMYDSVRRCLFKYNSAAGFLMSDVVYVFKSMPVRRAIYTLEKSKPSKLSVSPKQLNLEESEAGEVLIVCGIKNQSLKEHALHQGGQRDTRQKKPRDTKRERPRYQNKKSCGNCGRSHEPKQCPAYGKTCNSCGKSGHFAKLCRSSKNRPNSHHNSHVQHLEIDGDTSDHGIDEVQGNIHGSTNEHATLKINNKPIQVVIYAHI
ncbi:uncharacterized protein K02A2.6-like, partial [Paramuricea clavata]